MSALLKCMMSGRFGTRRRGAGTSVNHAEARSIAYREYSAPMRAIVNVAATH